MTMIRIFSTLGFPAVLLCSNLSAQNAGAPPAPAAALKSIKSNIVRVSGNDSSVVKITMRDAFYAPQKGYLPYFLLSKRTDIGQNATPVLVIKEIKALDAKQTAVVKQFYSKHIGAEFAVEAVASHSQGQNMNHHHLTPFRVNAQGIVEELVEYGVEWRISDAQTGPRRRGADAYKSSSVLRNGTWYKISVTKTGIHKIDRAFLSDIGINVTNLDPKKIRIYGNGGKMVPERNADFRYDDLEENAIFVMGEEDGKFDSGDYVLFFATGTTAWQPTGIKDGLRFNATTSLYSDTSFYFINVDLGPGKRMQNLTAFPSPENVSTSTYDFYNVHELNNVNFGKTGREFYGEYFDIVNSYSFRWDDGNFVVGAPLHSEVSVVSRYSDSVRFSVTFGSSNYVLATRGLFLNNTHEDYAAPALRRGSGLVTNPSELVLTVTKTTPKSIGWLNKVVVNARRNLTVSSRQFCFRDLNVAAPGNICRYKIGFAGNTGLMIFNVSDPLNVKFQSYGVNGQDAEFTASCDSLTEYCAAPPSDYYVPAFTGRVANQNLHAQQQADYLIVTHPLFIREAERLGAFHLQQDGLSYVVTPIDQIYNEFGSGKQDPAAIRDYIRMLYLRNAGTARPLKYVLLFGDGSYNNKNRSTVNNSNFIPTYQSLDALSETQSVATDDFYAMMDDNEGYNAEYSGLVDLGVGRLMCRTKTEANAIIEKIVNYYRKDAGIGSNDASQATMGDWRNWLLFLGDDEDDATHMDQANQLANIVNTYAPFCNTDKIFLDAYQRYSTPGGFRYPDAANDFLKRIRRGALVFNYTGHGGEVGLTAERMIDIDIINSLDNFNKLPLFVTATCEFSRYDDPARTSAGELCLLNAKGGAISLFTTCRLAFSNTNFNLNSILLKHMFRKLPDGRRPRLGDIMQKTKAETGQALLANFHLLGDPALTLAYPEHRVVTTAINNVPVTATGKADTLAALSKITIRGFVSDTLGNKINSFSGVVYPTVFDKEQTISGLLNSDESAINRNSPTDSALLPFKFRLQRNILYRGKIEVTNGDFVFSFLVPKDISFSPGPGRISYYASNGVTDATGYYTRLVVGGSSKNAFTDNVGPKIDLYLNDKSFVSGSVVNEKPIVFASLSDSSGINTVGSGIGHDISIILDQNTNKPINLNDYYEADMNSYQSGKIRYPFNKLSEGNHQLSFRAWDIQNNSSVSNLDFVVANSEEMALDNVLNYPNPFTTHTKFMFQHNQGCNPLKVIVQVYTVSGKAVKTIQKSVTCSDTGSQSVDWDGKDDYGEKLARGVYIYKLSILDSESKKAEKIEKLVILN